MSTQSTLPFSSLGTPVKSPSSKDSTKGNSNKREFEEVDDDIPLGKPEKKIKTNLPSPEVEEQVVIIDDEKSIELLPKSQESTQHKQQKKLQDEKIRLAKEKEKEEKRLKKEEEKQRREQKKKEIEEEKKQKRLKIEDERRKKREELEKQKEEKRKKLEQEKQERELKRLKLEQEKEERKKKLEKERLEKIQERELAEKKKQEEEEKKSRAQMRIGSFFKVKAEVPLLPTIAKAVTNDSYSSSFLLFFVKKNAQVYRDLTLDSAKIELNNKDFESSIKDGVLKALDFFKETPNTFCQSSKKTTAFEIVQALNNNHSETEILKLVEQVPRKYLSFYENLRPPYSGTVSKTIENVNKAYDLQLHKNPFTKVNDATIDYSYDSDLEWNPEEDDEGEGEEIDDEEMSAAEASDDEDDDDDFLEKDMQLKKRTLIGPLIPVVKFYSDSLDETEEDKYFQSLSLESLKFEYPIDPFKDYWQKNVDPTPVAAITNEPEIITVASLNPSVPPKTGSSPLKVNTNTVNVLTGHKKPKLVITNDIELLKVLQYVASNNDLSISTLVELTRKSLDNKYPNLVVRATIDKYFNKKNKKTYELNEENTITNLESVVKGINPQ